MGGAGGARSFLAEFQTLAKDMSIDRGATHFTLGLRPCIISSFPLQICLRPPLKLSSCAPGHQDVFVPVCIDWVDLFRVLIFSDDSLFVAVGEKESRLGV